MIAGWTDPVAAPDDSYSCIACCSVQKKVFCAEVRCCLLCCLIVSFFDWRCFFSSIKRMETLLLLLLAPRMVKFWLLIPLVLYGKVLVTLGK